MKSSIILATSLSTVLSLSLFAVEANAEGFGKADIDNFCAQSTNKAVPGMQFDNKKANKNIMQLKPGKYKYPGKGMLLLFKNNNYLLRLPDNRNGIHGTDGDDLLAAGGIVGGCGKEQLSEAFQKNKLNLKKLKLLKLYTK